MRRPGLARAFCSAVFGVVVWLAQAPPALPVPVDILPGESAFRPLLADPREAQYLMRYLLGASRARGEAAFGDTFGLVRVGDIQSVQFGIQASVYTRFNRDVNSVGFLDVNSADYTIFLPVDVHQGPVDVRVGLGHLSSHLGETEVQRRIVFGGANFFDRAFLYRRDFIRSVVSFETTEAVRLYAGGSYGVHVTPLRPRGAGQVGAELLSTPRLLGRLQRQWYLAVDFQSWAEADWALNANLQVGLRLSRHDSLRRLRVALDVYHGRSLMNKKRPPRMPCIRRSHTREGSRHPLKTVPVKSNRVFLQPR
ncbi:MAG: DUF1207 domain-containing protein [Nitrospirae bacterium]|nr:DUF1207 domain-containing protein [Nitrospirota bacterium]